MERMILLRAGSKRHMGALAGILLLLFIVSLSLTTLLTIWTNSNRYVNSEMERLGFGDLTVWVSGVPDLDAVSQQLSAVPEVGGIGAQELIFSNFLIGEQESDSEGQLIAYAPDVYDYRFFADDLSDYRPAPKAIQPGEVYVSPSLVSMFGVKIGDTIDFPIARNGGTVSMTVSGFYEDPFMGSSMIGMKGFLVSHEDSLRLSEQIAAAGVDALARSGAMLHLFQSPDSDLNISEFNAFLNENTSLVQFTEASHSFSSIAGFMLILQNAFTGFLLAFVAVLLAVSMLVLGHNISSGLAQDAENIGILKGLGFTTARLRQVQMCQYLLPILSGLLLGVIVSLRLSGAAGRMLVTTSGILIPNRLPLGICALALAAILLLLSGFIAMKLLRMDGITPMQAINQTVPSRSTSPIQAKGLSFWIALRQLATGKRQYVSACIVAVLLVFFSSMMGRMNSWLGPNGEGMMDAFNPSDLDLAVQPIGEVSVQEIETVIAGYSSIAGRYELAMPSVAINGVDLTANVITQPERFHMVSGAASSFDNEVVLTEFVAADLGVSIGDTVTLTGDLGSGQYIVSGIYQCTNDMGANIGMSAEGYAKIGTSDDPHLWCTHYFLADPSQSEAITSALEDQFGHDVHVHQNSWPGLSGIIAAMRLLIIFMYGATAVFILVAVTLTSTKLLMREQKDLAVYRTLGFSTASLRRAFALRFGVVSLLGGIAGIFLSAVLTDPLVAAAMRLYGISNFNSQPNTENVFLPMGVVSGLFVLFAYLAASKIRRAEMSALMAE